MTVIDVADAKAHMNIVSNDDDAVISAKIEAAEAWIERWLPQSFADMGAVPADLKEAIRQLVAHLYENREATITGVTAEEIPFGVWDLIAPHRAYSFGA